MGETENSAGFTEPPSAADSLIHPQNQILSSGHVCHARAAFFVLGGNMARKTGQIIRRGSSTWLVRIYVGRDPETRRYSTTFGIARWKFVSSWSPGVIHRVIVLAGRIRIRPETIA